MSTLNKQQDNNEMVLLFFVMLNNFHTKKTDTGDKIKYYRLINQKIDKKKRKIVITVRTCHINKYCLIFEYFLLWIAEKFRFQPSKCQCCPHMETSQLICTANYRFYL